MRHVRLWVHFLLSFLLFFLPFSSLIHASADGSSVSAKQRYLVMFHGPAEKGILKAFAVKDTDILYEYKYLPVYLVEMTPQQVKGLSHHPQIEFVEPDYEVRATGQTIPWGVSHIGATTAHAYGYVGSGIKVAILDTGIDRAHPDLMANVKGGYSVFTDSANNNPFFDGNGHGTHVAGTVAAVQKDTGIIGVAPSASLYAVKVLDNNGSGSYSGIAKGIEWAIANHMDIINMSLGSPYYSSIIEQYVNLAYYNYGMILVAAAGNSGNSRGTGDSVEYPARFAAVIAVAAIDANNQRAYFSSTGKKVELSAPGVNILSTIPGQSYAYYSGTSMAAPHVAGSFALVWSAKPYLSNVQLRQLLTSTALYLGKQEHYGYGLVQPWAAINR